MKGDYSRNTFAQEKHYSNIRIQQGRVQTDADFNEQIDIATHRVETGAKDMVGYGGVPAKDPGFGISGDNGNIIIGKGRCYLDGALIENENDVDYMAQKDMPGASAPGENGVYLAYLDMWPRHISALDDPDIIDAALDGHDTATRVKNLWQVKLTKLGESGFEANPEQKELFVRPGKVAYFSG